MSCFACDPEINTVYGWCESCGRKCEPPLPIDLEDITIEDWIEHVDEWQKTP
jgi:hypothetical protein